MTYLYVGRHDPEGGVANAPRPQTTVVSPRPLTGAEIVAEVVKVRALPALRAATSFRLTYPPTPSDPRVALDMLQATYSACGRCHLSERRARVCFLKGNPYAAVLALGEGPGRTENDQGVPFVGKSGCLQDALFRDAGIDPQRDVAWTNLVGCRPCDNTFAEDRKPNRVEAVACSERLMHTFHAIRPRVVLCLGAVALTAFFRPGEEPPLNTFVSLPTGVTGESVLVGHLRHPSYLLRIGQQPNMYAEWAGARLALRQLRAWLPVQKVAAWPFGLRYVADLTAPEAAT